jgi:protein-L-isoaspartate(D-aspartate) O-methyltransferase
MRFRVCSELQGARRMPSRGVARFGVSSATRRELLAASAGLLLSAPFGAARADISASLPLDSRQGFVDWIAKNRNDNPNFLDERWNRYQALLAYNELQNDRNKRAFLMTPREEFVSLHGLSPRSVYQIGPLDIGYGVTISGPHLVGHMTSAIDVQPDDKVLEIGTGSGYQSAYLSNLTNKVWTVEIIKPLAQRTRGVYDALIARGYGELKSITTKNADGYYGWSEFAPFDKIIVTCGIDHIPPPLLEQLKPGGIMVIPIGPPGAQHVLKIVKRQDSDGSISVARSDLYNGRIIPFVPFTMLQDGRIRGTHRSVTSY